MALNEFSLLAALFAGGKYVLKGSLPLSVPDEIQLLLMVQFIFNRKSNMQSLDVSYFYLLKDSYSIDLSHEKLLHSCEPAHIQLGSTQAEGFLMDNLLSIYISVPCTFFIFISNFLKFIFNSSQHIFQSCPQMRYE